MGDTGVDLVEMPRQDPLEIRLLPRTSLFADDPEEFPDIAQAQVEHSGVRDKFQTPHVGLAVEAVSTGTRVAVVPRGLRNEAGLLVITNGLDREPGDLGGLSDGKHPIVHGAIPFCDGR